MVPPLGSTSLFFPIVNVSYSAFLNDPPETRTAEYIREFTASYCDAATIRDLSVSIDGVPVARPSRYVVTAEQSPLFMIQLPTDNFFGVTPDLVPDLVFSPSAHQGFYIAVKPLPPGPHTIKWTGTWDCQFGTFSQNLQYDLNVLKGVPGLVEEE